MADSFFASQKPAAVFKHGVLDSYVAPFIGKTGSTSRDHRVAFIDGYAGPGKYDDDTYGSPARAIELAREWAHNRRVECYFVEKNPEYLEPLNALVAEKAAGLSVEVLEGDINDHMANLVEKTASVPTFMFLDPFGLVVPFSSVVHALTRPSGYGMPNIEVLINFSSAGLRRIAGMLDKSAATQGREASLARMDEVCGGNWWRELWEAKCVEGSEVAEEAVVVEYARRLADTAGGYGWWATDVKNRPEHKPVYYLVFLSRHIDGLHVFGEAHSLALEKWRRAIYNQDYSGTLFDSEEAFTQAEADLSEAWAGEIEKNLREMLSGGGFSVKHRYPDVFGSAVGQAREKHLRAAWRRLFQGGATSTDPKGKKLMTTRIEPF